ncbi:MAG: ABC transporter ATP-binding protein [Planctomycetota bacterium]
MEPVIQIEQLRMSYGVQEVLRGIDLVIGRGEILGYLGPNGAGKTTTVRILTGLIDEYTGSVSVCGLDVRSDPLGVKRRIGFVPEHAALYEQLTALEFLDLVSSLHGASPAATRLKASGMLETLGLRPIELERRIETYSKGMRQKVLLVAGLLHDPEVLFLDEPLSGLDANTALIVKEILQELRALGKTIFYCSHVLDVVERTCDRIVILSDGRIVADGSFEALQQQRQGSSLERIFTELTSEGQQAAQAAEFVARLRS